jgi:hypothetical protein
MNVYVTSILRHVICNFYIETRYIDEQKMFFF